MHRNGPLPFEACGTRHISPLQFEELMKDRLVTSFVYAYGDLAYSAPMSAELRHVKQLAMGAHEKRFGQLTQARNGSEAMKRVGGAKFSYIFTKRKFLEDDSD